MTQLQKVTGRATTITHEGNITRVAYHNTDVVTIRPESIVLRSGGWQTYTTKARMNQASNHFGLGYRVYAKDRQWFVAFKGQTLNFVDGMRLER